jgi:exonuclease III
MSDSDVTFAIWNGRGLNSPARRLAVYQAISPANAAVVCIQETKMAVISNRVVRDCLGPSFDQFFFLPADGMRGGILLAWQSAVFSISHPHFTANVVTACISIGVDQSWWFTGVYGPQRDVDKRAFLHELQDIHDLHIGPWLVAGDFNLIVDPADKSRGCLHRTMMSRFRRTLSALELKELYLNGRRFTWSNEREQPTLEKLDRVFSTVEWDALYPDAFLSAMSTCPSDHCPLVLNLSPDLFHGR